MLSKSWFWFLKEVVQREACDVGSPLVGSAAQRASCCGDVLHIPVRCFETLVFGPNPDGGVQVINGIDKVCLIVTLVVGYAFVIGGRIGLTATIPARQSEVLGGEVDQVGAEAETFCSIQIAGRVLHILGGGGAVDIFGSVDLTLKGQGVGPAFAVGGFQDRHKGVERYTPGIYSIFVSKDFLVAVQTR